MTDRKRPAIWDCNMDPFVSYQGLFRSMNTSKVPRFVGEHEQVVSSRVDTPPAEAAPFHVAAPRQHRGEDLYDMQALGELLVIDSFYKHTKTIKKCKVNTTL